MRKSCQMEVQIPVQWVLSSATELNALFSGEGENMSFALPLDEKSSAKLNKKRQCSDKCSLVYSAEKIEIDLEKYKFAGIELKHPKYPILFKYEINPKKSAKNISPSKIFFAGEEYSVE